MKKIFSIFVATIMAMCMCIPLAACGNDDKTEDKPIKRIAGLDSEKTYVKGKFYLENQFAFHEKSMYLEVLSYDKIEKDELEAITFDISHHYEIPTVGNEPQKIITELRADNFELKFGESKWPDGCYHYYVYMNLTADKMLDGFKINSINMTIAGRVYKFSSEIIFQLRSNPVYISPNTFGNTVGDPVKGADSILINTRYDMTLKSLNYQTEGYEIISYYAQKFEGYTSDGKPKDGEKISESLPIELKKDQTYQIFVEAVVPDDCLYYSNGFEAIVEIQGVEIFYCNYSGLDSYNFKGSAVSSDFDEDAHE